jgi:hypothetical protein
MGDPMCGMIARKGGWHREQERDCCANGRGPERPKGDPSSKQNNNAHNASRSDFRFISQHQVRMELGSGPP